MLVAVASLWRTVAEDAYYSRKKNKYMTILGSASIGLGILALEGRFYTCGFGGLTMDAKEKPV